METLYLQACCDYWGPIAEQLLKEGRIGLEGLTEADLAEWTFMDLDEFRELLDTAGISYRP